MTNASRVLVLACVLGASGGAWAADGDKPASGGGGDWRLTLKTEPSFTFRADLDDDHGSVSILRTDFGADLSGPVGDRMRLTVGLFGGVANYDFDDFSGAGATGSPLDDAYEAGVSLLAVYSFDQQWFMMGRGSVASGWADGADFGDGVFGTAALGLGYKFSESFSLALGGGFVTRLEDEVGFLPLVVINWKINEKVSLETTGIGLKLSGALSDEWTVFLRGGGEYHQYRLGDDRGAAPGGAMTDVRVPVGVGFDWKPAAGLTLSLEGGVVVYQEYQIRNDDREIDEFNTDPAAYIAGRISYRF